MSILSYLFATLGYAGLWYGEDGRAFAQPISSPFRVVVPQCDENGNVIWDPSEPVCLTEPNTNNPLCAPVPPIYQQGFTPPALRSYMSVANELSPYYLASLGLSEEQMQLLYVPKTAVVTGGSRGIGHAVACNLADLQDTKGFQDAKVVSLSKRDPDFECDGVTYINFDISDQDDGSSSSEDSKWVEVDDALGDSSIDFLLLGAGYDAVGSMRDMTRDDLERIFANNVWGNHDVWLHLREELNPSFSVVLGVSSIAGKVSNFFFKRQSYSFTKAMMDRLILAYAYEESELHPNIRYGSIIQGDAKSKFGLTTLIPNANEGPSCKAQFDAYGTLSNSYVTQFGMELADVAKQYHKIFTLYGLIKDGYLPTLSEMPPQRFSVAGGEGFDEAMVDVGMYNTNVLRPEATLKCYSNLWERSRVFYENSCPIPPVYLPTCTGLEFIAPFVDPRTETCAVV